MAGHVRESDPLLCDTAERGAEWLQPALCCTSCTTVLGLSSCVHSGEAEPSSKLVLAG